MFNPFPWAEVVNPKPEPKFTLEHILRKMVEIYGDNLANPENYPLIAKHQFKVAKYLCEQDAKKADGHTTGYLQNT